MNKKHNAISIARGVIEIKPRVIFSKIEELNSEENIQFIANIPSSNIGGLTLLESSIMVCLIKLINPDKIFEFGTFMGATTILLAQNSGKKTKVVTLDLNPKDMTFEVDSVAANHDYIKSGTQNDDYLRSIYSANTGRCITKADQHTKSKIEQIFIDSTKLNIDCMNMNKSFDMIFVDGGHDYFIVENDTIKALEMAKEDSIIIWHDFKSQVHTDVTRFIEEISKKQPILHIQSTMLAIMLNGKFKNLFA